jgi:peptide/nickel transport system permease protein
MSRYVVRRLLVAVPTLFVISFVIYAILALAPTDPLSQLFGNPNIPPEVKEQIRHNLGLDQPWHIRYVKWFLALLTGDMGWSFVSRVPVSELIGQRLPQTLAVVGVAEIIGLVVGLPIGLISAVRRYSIFDHAATLFAFIGFSLPTFFTGIVLIVVFSVKLHWLPFIYDSTLKIHDLPTLLDQAKQSIMPITVLGLFNAAIIARYVRAEMLERLPLDYVRTARAKGLAERVVVLGHVLRNSLIPVVTLVALSVPTVFGGAIVTEQIFRVNGIGELLVRSINDGDIPVVAGLLFIFSILVIGFNLLADVLYGVLDPRIRFA